MGRHRCARCRGGWVQILARQIPLPYLENLFPYLYQSTSTCYTPVWSGKHLHRAFGAECLFSQVFVWMRRSSKPRKSRTLSLPWLQDSAAYALEGINRPLGGEPMLARQYSIVWAWARQSMKAYASVMGSCCLEIDIRFPFAEATANVLVSGATGRMPGSISSSASLARAHWVLLPALPLSSSTMFTVFLRSIHHSRSVEPSNFAITSTPIASSTWSVIHYIRAVRFYSFWTSSPT